MESKLKQCPFCGSEAEMYTGRLWPQKNVALCVSEADAQDVLETYDAIGVVVNSGIYRKTRFTCGKGRIPGKWAVWVQLQGFIPRCTNSKCIARSDYMFLTEAEALEAWNRRR